MSKIKEVVLISVPELSLQRDNYKFKWRRIPSWAMAQLGILLPGLFLVMLYEVAISQGAKYGSIPQLVRNIPMPTRVGDH